MDQSRKRRANSPLTSGISAKKPKQEVSALSIKTQKQHDNSPALLKLPNSNVDIDSDWAQQYRIPNLPGADVYYQADFVDEERANSWYQRLCELETWYRPTLTMYGKGYIQSRSIAGYVTSPDLTARYSGHSVQMNHPYPPLLIEIQNRVSEALGVGFDHIMLNWYQNGSVHIGKHRDTKDNQVIASLSLGAKRTFVMHPHISKGEKKVDADATRWVLANGSLLVMQGDTQENWKHEIPKEPKVKEGRISLTFRQIVHA
ncbi:SubName: Full=Uncharacterized protein {ECO:0000313/EMBL:CCA73190.1} [Serendipita indica DSM 11827]|nr:SubName: Full=Uncharacterized protein {ECO:0000313/EMBL:CCA73190.1} [Serendipita indica DSM 11827]